MATEALAVDGASLQYEVVGTGPAVVLIHGFSLDMRMWDPQLPDLAAAFRVVRYDCRGFGASGPLDPAIPYTHAADLVALLDHLSIDQAALVGLSFGGHVALSAALLAPERVRALVLLDACWRGRRGMKNPRTAWQSSAGSSRPAACQAGREAWLAHPLFAAARQQPLLRARLAEMVAVYLGQHWLGRDPHLPDSPAPIDLLEQLTMPALVVAGEQDVPGFRAMTDVLAQRLPAAELVLVPSAGHMVNMEQQAVVNPLLVRFLRAHAA